MKGGTDEIKRPVIGDEGCLDGVRWWKRGRLVMGWEHGHLRRIYQGFAYKCGFLRLVITRRVY